MTDTDRTDTPRRDAEERMLQASDAPQLVRWVDEPSEGFYRGAARPGWVPPADYRDHLTGRPNVPRPLPQQSIEEQTRAGIDEERDTLLRQLVHAHVQRCSDAHRAVLGNATVAARTGAPADAVIAAVRAAVEALTRQDDAMPSPNPTNRHDQP